MSTERNTTDTADDLAAVEDWALTTLRGKCVDQTRWLVAVGAALTAVAHYNEAERHYLYHLGATPPDPWSDETEVNPDFSELAREAEELLQTVSEPHVKQHLTINEDVSKPPESWTLNIFKQKRTAFSLLKNRKPGDEVLCIIHEIMKKNRAHKPEVPLPIETQIRLAAIETVYSYLPEDLWSTEAALAQVEDLIKRHRED